MNFFPPEVIEYVVDFLDDDRASLLSCSMVARAWHVRSVAHLFRVLQVCKDPYSWDRWMASDTAPPVAFIRVTVVEFNQLLHDFAHLIRYVEHLQIGDPLEEGNGPTLTTFLRTMRLPDGHSVQRLSLSGDLYLPLDHDRRLSHNFGRVTVLRMHGTKFSYMFTFAEIMLAFRCATFVEMSGPMHMTVGPNIVQGDMAPPFFAQPCAMHWKLDLQTTSPVAPLSVLLAWVAKDPSHVSTIHLTGDIPKSRDGTSLRRLLEADHGVRRRVHRLTVEFGRDQVPDLAAIVSHLPCLSILRCSAQYKLYPSALARILASEEFTSSSLRAIEVSVELYDTFNLGVMTRDAWESLLIPLSSPKWRSLQVFVVRLLARQRVPLTIKRPIREMLANICHGSSLRVLLDDPSEQESTAKELSFQL
ncbi:hypothetical protein EXIGLDRAFT_774283 [Exidia glandulosa HHB12029]|uniref:F-box domain-containing protein n=1 Tax=Exidia glandulosa HHB12029 TaxID=1314781 RepID=A0A165EFE3_EXIGL|nr:hypothetical protein EXIGLDRAFT_774283 [Exidia glandulosa HHB12029]